MLGGGGAIGDLERERERLPDDERCLRDESRSLLRFLEPIFHHKIEIIQHKFTQIYAEKTQHKSINFLPVSTLTNRNITSINSIVIDGIYV